MAIIYNPNKKIFTLHTAHTTYQMQVDPLGYLLHLYYGEKTNSSMDYVLTYADRGFSGNPYAAGMDRTYSLDALPQEYPSIGTGDYRNIALNIKNEKGVESADLLFKSYEIRSGKYQLQGLPAVWADKEEAQTLEIVLADENAQVEVHLLYGVLEENDVITRSVRIKNTGTGQITIEKAAAACLDFVQGDFDVLRFYGKHAMERNLERTPLGHGTIALITVFTTIMQVFVDSGLGTALIQKKDADDLDFSSVFYFNFVVCLVLYGVMFVAAPLIAAFYNDATLTPLVRVISLTIVISGVKGIQQSYVSRNMLFKRFFFATLGGTIFSAFLGIGLAYAGFGVWAIVVQQLSNTIIDTLILWLTVKWRPKKKFSWQRLKGLLTFGWKLLASALLDTVYNNLRSLVIGKMYSSADLAYYNQADKFPNVVVNNINSSIDSVLLPTMASAQDDPVQVKAMTRRAIKTSTYIMAPLMMGLAFCAEPVIKLVLTDKWLSCVPFMQIFCITYMFYPIHTANLNAIKAMGRSDLFLKLEIVKKIMGMVLLLSTMWFGVMAMAYSLLVSSLLSQIINSWPNWKLLDYSYFEQLKDIMPGIILAVIMGCCVYLISLLGLSSAVTLLIQVPLGAGIYIGASAVLQLESFEYLWSMVKSVKAGKF